MIKVFEMRKLTVGIVAHVDSGKTTLSEALLYETGAITSLGRVDNKNAYLDTNPDERSRGITIYSKNARISLEKADAELVLIDTPGHVDFGTEMERALSVLDMAILIVSASSGVQAHTRTLWSLLNSYRIPTYIFVNKMDMPDTDKGKVLTDIREKLQCNAVDFSEDDTSYFYEECATASEDMLNEFLETDKLSVQSIVDSIYERRLFPVCFGSALKLEGIREFIAVLSKYLIQSRIELTGAADEEFSGIVYKISRDAKGQRLTFMKILSGKLQVKSYLGDEKINEIRLYSGEKYTSVKEAEAGEICAVVSPSNTKTGDVIGKTSREIIKPHIVPALSYAVIFPSDVDRNAVLRNLNELAEEDPSLGVTYSEETKEILIYLMGDVQAEILKNTIRDRFDLTVDFADGRVLYKETVDGSFEGVGHFEPLRHYAEAHILISPNERGTGMTFSADISEDLLDRNWQRLIYTHMVEKEHRGILLGAPITDIHLELVSGKAHLKHTEGGDFRQATYRAIRQGLMELRARGHCHLLEPYYEYTLEVPEEYVGRAMTDITGMMGSANISETDIENHTAVLTGKAPVSTMNGYTKDVAAYTKGLGRLYLSLAGYEACHNEEEVLSASRYDPESDMRNPSASVFCSHGAGTVIPWDEVPEHMHIAYGDGKEISHSESLEEAEAMNRQRRRMDSRSALDATLSVSEIDSILKSAGYANEKGRQSSYKGVSAAMRQRRREMGANAQQSAGAASSNYKGAKIKDKYILIDGYNVIHAWPELSQYLSVSIDSAAEKLNDIMCNYRAIRGVPVMVVYDAYKVKGRHTEEKIYQNITVVYTGEALTADRYIERYAHENSSKYDITVVTSDGMEQIIVSGAGANITSAREFREEVDMVISEFRLNHGVTEA